MCKPRIVATSCCVSSIAMAAWPKRSRETIGAAIAHSLRESSTGHDTTLQLAGQVRAATRYYIISAHALINIFMPAHMALLS